MKMIKFLSAMVMSMLLIIVLNSCTTPSGSGNKNVTLNNDLDSVSYAIGIDIGNNLKSSGFDAINAVAVAMGFSDAFSDAEGKMDPESANKYVMSYFNKAKDKKAQENLKKSQEFLAENKTKEGVITTESGLQYKIITEGTGPIPTATDKVSVNYRGTLIDGTEFDKSEEGKPVQFRVNGVIKGWTEALQLMPVGSKWQLFIPSDLAYGANPRPGKIQPNDALIFDIELLEIVKE